MTRPVRGAMLLALSATAVFGQAPRPAFEVATIKEHQPPLSRIFDFSSSGPRVKLEGYLPVHLLMEAYGLKGHEISMSATLRQLPDDVHYDVIAKAEGDGPRTRNDFRPMLQTLLAERCKLETHWEMKEMPVFALVVAKGGVTFKESAPDAVFRANHGVNGKKQNVDAQQYTMTQLADSIFGSFGVGRPVVDRTGLTGKYSIKLEATPEYRLREPEPGDISIFDAVQSQLGLKLEAQKAMLRVLVVDRWEKPSAN